MGQVFVRRSTAALLFLVATLCIVCVALLVLLLAPDWRDTGGETTSGRLQETTTTPRPQRPVQRTTTPTQAPSTTTSEGPKEPWEAEYRIPKTTLPHHYDLYLHPDLESGRFSGRVGVVIGVTSPMTYLVIHFKLMNITRTELRATESGVTIPLKKYFEYEVNQFWVVLPKVTLQPGNYTLSLEFEGSLDGSIVGFYRSVYTTKAGEKRSIATSKFQPTDARSAFPCFDEPSFKSTFSTTLVRPSAGYIALSNMPVEREVGDAPKVGLTEVVFEKSVPMVTYLACFIVCDFDHIEETTRDGKKFRVYATPDQIDRANYSLHLGVNVLNFFEDYFQIKYPLPKQDMIAIPDFISGAMEHWGLITYRESTLLYDDSSSSSYNKQRVAAVVSHELAHMWFGNLMTLEWWDDLWLNEGFASYIEYKGVANYEKDWDMGGQFLVDDLQRVMGLDAQLSSHPIVQSVNHPDEITEIFDVISYSKGASVLRMLEDFLGSEQFRQGVSNFLRRYRFANAVTRDLWRELEEVALPGSPNITQVMDTWTRQMGYPVLHVTTSKEDKNKLEVRQRRFLSDPEAVSAEDSPFGYKWDIPVTFASDVTARQQMWLHRGMDRLVLMKPAGARWIKFNIDQYGYYRVNYEPAMWSDLISILHENPEALNATDRGNLLDDAFYLAGADLLPYPTVLSLVGYMTKETHYIPWATVASHLDKMGRLLRTTKGYPYFRKYMVNLVKDHVETLGWEDTGNHLDRRKRLVLMYLACSNGYEPCLNGAYERLSRWIQDQDFYIPPNTRSLVYKFGMQKAGVDEWEVMLDRYVKENNAQEKIKLAAGLATTKEDWIAQRYLRLAANESIVRSQDFFRTLQTLAKNPWNTQLVWSYVKSNWEKLVERFTLNNRYMGSMVKYVTTRLGASDVALQDIRAFFAKHPKAGSGARARQQALEKVEENVRWIDNHAALLHSWFLKQSLKK